MLKFIVPLVFLMKFSKNWKVIQIGVFFMSFVVGLSFDHNTYMFSLSGSLGADYISFIMIYLSFWIMSLILLASPKMKALVNFSSSFTATNLLLLMALVYSFSSMDYLMFYISFEASLIPTLILILGWGYQPERIQAGVYMLFYTLAFSLPLLASLLY